MYARYAKIRDERGLTDFAVCKATGIAPSIISYWKNGKTVPRVEKLIKIADLLGTTIDALVRED